MFKLVLEKAEEPEMKLPTSTGCWKKQESFRKPLTSALLTMPKPLIVWITTNWKILKEMGMPGHLTCLLRNLYADQEAIVRTRHGATDWFQVKKAEIYVFLELSCFSHDPADVHNLISGSSAFSKISLSMEVHGSHIVEAWLGEF